MQRTRFFQATILTLLLLVMGTPAARADNSIWFEDARYSPALSDDAVRAVAAHVRHRLFTPEQLDNAPLLPQSVKDDFYPRIVIISASDGIRTARVAAGTARGIIKAADHALLQLRMAEQDQFEPRWIKLDHPSTIILQEKTDLNLPLEYERSLFGIAFPRQSRLALLPEELIANDIVSEHQEFFADRLGTYLDWRKPKVDRTAFRIDAESATFFRFSSQCWFIDRNEITPLIRGHRHFHRLTQKDLKDSAEAAQKYLTHAVGRSGQFDYLYQPSEDRLVADYSLSHHFGAVLSMIEAYEVFKDEKQLEAVKRAMDFGENSIGMWTQRGKRVPAVIEHSMVNLGNNALATAAMARIAHVTGDAKMLTRTRSFAGALETAQREDGSFIQLQRFPDGQSDIVDHPYLSGQAISSLMFVQAVAPDSRWVTTADKGAQYLILTRDKGLPLSALPQDPWLLNGLSELYHHQPRDLYLAYSATIVRAISQSQLRKPPLSDWYGGYDTPPGSTPTAMRTQGLVAAYTLLRDHGGKAYRDDAVTALEASILGAAFQLQCQFRPENAMYYKNPQRVLGAFRESLTSPNIRIDFVQHNMMGLLNLWRVMQQEKIESYAVPGLKEIPDDVNNRSPEEIKRIEAFE